MTDTFDMDAELRRRDAFGRLNFPAGPVIAGEMIRLRAKIGSLEAEIEKRMADEAMNAARIDELKEALADVFTGWDALAGERFHSPGAVEKWLNKDIGPAILRARAVAFASDGGEHE